MGTLERFPNDSFSKKEPLLQLFLDSTSLNEFKICPRRYYYSIVMGYQPAEQSVHLTFGILLHQAVEHYWLLRLNDGCVHAEALRRIVKEMMVATWDAERGRGWQTDHKAKNRFTLLRTVVWYLDKYQDDPVETLRVHGRVAVELPFKISTNYESSRGEQFVLCGKIDRLGQLNGNKYITDIKSTSRPTNSLWYSRFSPDNQFSIYAIASRLIYQTEVLGVLVDGCQIVQSFSEFGRGIVQRTPEQLDAWLEDLGMFLTNLEWCAKNDNWPMNDSVCNLWGGCPFRQVCAAQTPSIRDMLLKNEYKRRVWDPTFQQLDY